MGVSGFWRSLQKNFPGSFLSHKISATDHILIDVNNILHSKLRNRPSNFDTLALKLFKELNKSFQKTKPSKTAFLALDGPSTVAKMKLQKKRRLKIVKKSTKIKKGSFNSCALTPGTIVMEKCKQALLYYIYLRIEKSKREAKNVNYIVSGSDAPGEGELKIISWIHQTKTEKSKNQRYLIVGGDSDFAIFSFALKDMNICIDSDQPKIFSTAAFRKCLLDKFPSSRLDRVLNDIILMMILQGNDYIPKLPGLGIDNQFIEYSRFRVEHPNLYIVSEDHEIIWKSLSLYLDEYCKIEMVDQKLSFLMKNRKPDPAKYFEGISWCMQMYTTGKCPDFNYDYKDPLAPTFKDLKQYVEKNGRIPKCKPIFGSLPMNPYEFGLHIMPKEVVKFLPEPLRGLKKNDRELDPEILRQKMKEKNIIDKFAPSIAIQKNPSSEKKFTLFPIPEPPFSRATPLKGSSNIFCRTFHLFQRKFSRESE